jgi:hypothetical protein
MEKGIAAACLYCLKEVGVNDIDADDGWAAYLKIASADIDSINGSTYGIRM